MDPADHQIVIHTLFFTLSIAIDQGKHGRRDKTIRRQGQEHAATRQKAETRITGQVGESWR